MRPLVCEGEGSYDWPFSLETRSDTCDVSAMDSRGGQVVRCEFDGTVVKLAAVELLPECDVRGGKFPCK